MYLTDTIYTRNPEEHLNIVFNTKPTSSIETLNYPLVSIIIVNYNYGHFLIEAIDSALNQTYSNIEVIVVDDGSTDNSHEIIKSYGDKIIPILKPNGGQPSAFNASFAVSKGETICFLDADDIFLPEKVEEISKIFTQHEEIGWCCHLLKFFGKAKNAEDNEKLLKNQSLWSSGIYDLRMTIKQGKLKGKIPNIRLSLPNICFRRSLLQQQLPMPETAFLKTTDEYLKYTALGLTPGFILLEELSMQRIHDDNAYTEKTDAYKQKLNAKINVFNAYWMKSKFPLIMSKFANNLFALGISIYWLHGGIEEESRYITDTYFSSLSLMESLNVYTRVYFNYFKYFKYLK